MAMNGDTRWWWSAVTAKRCGGGWRLGGLELLGIVRGKYEIGNEKGFGAVVLKSDIQAGTFVECTQGVAPQLSKESFNPSCPSVCPPLLLSVILFFKGCSFGPYPIHQDRSP
ncbi:unnamed protein product [Prunus armeniaca]